MYSAASRATGSFEHRSKTPKRSFTNDDDDLYAGFNDVAPALDTRSIKDDQTLRETLRTAGIGRTVQSRGSTGVFRTSTSFRLGTSTSRAGTMATGAGGGPHRPVTAVRRAAGYTSSATARSTPSGEEKKAETIEDKIKSLEDKIMRLIEESCVLSTKGGPDDPQTGIATPSDVTESTSQYDLTKALAKAQEASTLERQLIRIQEQASMGDSHNLDLTFAVLCNLAGLYALNEMYTEALNTYQLLTKNKLFPHANRLKVNMGNIYFKTGEHPKALKLYRMALDQTPTAEKDLRMKMMHNIGLLLVRMGKFRDAVGNLQHMMHEQPDLVTGLHLVLCSVALQDAEAGKAAFNSMLDAEPPSYHNDLPEEDESDAMESVLRDVLRSDRLSRWSRARAADAERRVLVAATALAPLLDSEEEDGMSWCVNALRGWEAGRGAAARLELSAALAALRPNAGNGAAVLSRIKAVTRANQNHRDVRADANADAAFVAYALGNFAEARKLGESSVKDNPYGCAARVTSALALTRGNKDRSVDSASSRESSGGVRAQKAVKSGSDAAGAWPLALEQLAAATHLDPSNMTALFDLAIAQWHCGSAEAAAARWARVRASSGAAPLLKRHAAASLAMAHHRAGDITHADHWYGSVGTGSGDVGIALALAQLHAGAGDSTAEHHYRDVAAVWPCDVDALSWLAEETKLESPSKAAHYYQRLATLEPGNPTWGLNLGACLRSSGKYQEALKLYKRMHLRFPDNTACLRQIVKMCGDQGLQETAMWSRELQQLLQQQQSSASNVSLGSASSRASQSPAMDVNKQMRKDSATHVASGLSTSSNPANAKHSKGKQPSFDDELPLPFD